MSLEKPTVLPDVVRERQSISQRMYNPVSTYRFQLNSEFTLDHLTALVPYLRQLGITTIYGSPIFVSTPGSSHGYDAVDPTKINPEIGTEAQLTALTTQLHETGMGWLQDIVPNHAAYHPTNGWLMDMLETGPRSRFAGFFENSLSSSFFRDRIEAPFLPAPLEQAIADGAIQLTYDHDRLVLQVQGNTLPLKPESYVTVLQGEPDAATPNAARPNQAIQELLTQLDQLHHVDDPNALAEGWGEFRLQLGSLMKNESTGAFIRSAIARINDSPEQITALATSQHYQFRTEPDTRREMNYRRFFTVNGLICLNIHEQAVFDAYHAFTKKLIDAGVFQGLRIDHVDGLYDPTTYLERLRELTGPETYLVVEKILQADEELPLNWPIEGASGYEFLAMLSNVMTDARSEPAFRDFYAQLVGNSASVHQQVRDRKAYFLTKYMGGELDNLYHYFLAQNLADEAELHKLRQGQLKQTMAELLVRCPVYRYYGNALPLPERDANALRSMLAEATTSRPELTDAATLILDVLLARPQTADADYNARALRFYQRLMQFTSPLMAKGVEDTLLYTYNAFIGHNEVGDAPERHGMDPNEFHARMQDRQQHWPLAMNTTSTHDTKRGEDVRARLNVLPDLADEWISEAQQWLAMLAEQNPDESTPGTESTYKGVPDANDAYFMLQNMIGAYPMPGEPADDFENRFGLYMEKALQEAKRHTTDWVVDETYHEGVRRFIARMFDRSGPFWARFEPFHHRVADFGVTNSLVQTVLKCTCPGVPDVYRGAEGWELSLVDPDNRRPVDFARHEHNLNALANPESVDWADLWQHRFDGRVKLALLRSLLHLRRDNRALFADGEYVPLTVEGLYKQHILAFMRRNGADCCVVVVPLYAAQLATQQHKTDLLTLNWQDTRITLPADAPTNWTSPLAGEPVADLSIQSLLKTLPVAVLVR